MQNALTLSGCHYRTQLLKDLKYILSVNEKLPLLKFRYFENYKRHLDSYFTFRVSDQLQTRLEQ